MSVFHTLSSFRDKLSLFLEAVALLCGVVLLLLAATSRSPLTRLDAFTLGISAVTASIAVFRVCVLVVWDREPEMWMRRLRVQFTMAGYYSIVLWTVLITTIRVTLSAPYASSVSPLLHPLDLEK